MNSHQPPVFSASCPRPTTALSHQLTCSDLVTPISSSHAVTEPDAMRKKKQQHQKNDSKNNPAYKCWISQRQGLRRAALISCTSWGESVPVPFCSTSCHWECGQQRAAWMHKYKLGGRIRQSLRARAGPRLRVSQHAARVPSHSYVDHREPGTVISISSITGPQRGPAAGGGNKGSV